MTASGLISAQLGFARWTRHEHRLGVIAVTVVFLAAGVAIQFGPF